MYRSEPDHVSGSKGHYEIVPWIKHPAFCVCDVCPKFREREAARTSKPVADLWAVEFPLRIRRVSPFPDNRKASAAAALRLKEQEEERLLDLLEQADAEKRARRTAVSFGVVVDAYRAHLIAARKEYSKSKSRINNIEMLMGRDRDVQAVDFAAYKELLAEVSELTAETQRHYASTLLAMLSFAKAERIIKSHQLEGVRVPQVIREDTPEPWSKYEVSVIMGPAMAEFEREQAAWNAKVAQDKANRGYRCPSVVPLRGLCLIAYLTLMRPKNNKALTWEEVKIDLQTRTGWFKLDQHKNVNRGIKARGKLAKELVDYLLSIRPANARGLIHPNPATGKAYVDLRKQWNRLMKIASRILGYELTGKKADFFNFRHSGASHMAMKGNRPRDLMTVVRMMGDTSLTTVNRHYFNIDDEMLEEVVEGWGVPELPAFAPEGIRAVS
jgi:integrase